MKKNKVEEYKDLDFFKNMLWLKTGKVSKKRWKNLISATKELILRVLGYVFRS